MPLPLEPLRRVALAQRGFTPVAGSVPAIARGTDPAELPDMVLRRPVRGRRRARKRATGWQQGQRGARGGHGRAPGRPHDGA
ncbi:hypothetical protein [Derxia gummosa]|uniref:Uncharacterized protein n=1 Tax=Derxia gummosa DSM 723 TaxID=1121388 RepID=A0A8B6X4Q2_9BURK|nr:hypothetical protein [Derxia gummosa]